MKRNVAKQVARELTDAGRPDLAVAFSRRAVAGPGFVIGPGGLEDPAAGIHLQPNTVYWMGASSSPSMIYVTSVANDMVEYLNYPFYENSGKLKSPKREQRWIAEDLIIKGCNTWLKTYAKYHPKTAKSIKNMLAGKKGTTEKIGNYEPWTVLAVPAKEGKDAWRDAEQYGNVAGMEWEGGPSYEIETTKDQISDIEKDKALKVVGKRKGHGRAGPGAYSSVQRRIIMARKIIKAAGGEAVPLPKQYAKEAEKLKAKGYKFMAQMLSEDGTPFGEPLPFKTADQMARFMRTEKMKIDWYSAIARTQVTAKSNAEVVRELKQMGILPQTENAGSYPAIGQDPTWMSLYSHKTVKAKTAAVAKCLRAGKTKLANVVAKIPVRSDLDSDKVEALAPIFADFVLGNRDRALTNLKKAAKSTPEVDMQAGGQYAKEFNGLRKSIDEALRKHTAGVAFASTAPSKK